MRIPSNTPVVIAQSEVDPNDLDLARRVTTFLATRHRPGLRSVEVSASSGVVTLRGSVSTFYEKQLSAQLAGRVAGVTRLVDHVVVNQRPIAFLLLLQAQALQIAG
jgi:osmotically-inducible protein OsmY